MAYTFTGNSYILRKKLSKFISETGIEELMVSSNIYNKDVKLKSFSILHDAIPGNQLHHELETPN